MAAIGYARVSTGDQTPALQFDALAEAGCERVFTDRASGASEDRPELAAMLDYARRGDVVVVWRLDRLGRSVRHLIELAEMFEDRGVELRSLTERLDTGSPGGGLVFRVFAAMAQMERELVRERTRAGLAAARARGRKGGRPSVTTPEKEAAAGALYAAGELTLTQIAAQLGVGRSTVTKHLGAVKAAAAGTCAAGGGSIELVGASAPGVGGVCDDDCRSA
ncbi:MAG: recombinase family protein, partial [Bifidobacteriaceae bacterium]|nr:recombinase family protein [Bifidobacteriaceae bacterium]